MGTKRKVSKKTKPLLSAVKAGFDLKERKQSNARKRVQSGESTKARGRLARAELKKSRKRK
jgi:hypothetical protein